MNKIFLELLNLLNTVPFEFTPEQLKKMQTAGLRNVRSYFSKKWAVRMRIAGNSHTLGITTDPKKAARWADMSHLLLVNAGARSFRVNDFNFDKATAEADLQHPVAGPLLGEILTTIFPDGIPTKPKPRTTPRKSLRNDLVTLRTDFEALRLTVCSIQDKLSTL